MRLLLRCDAGATTGVGHAVRCAALAEAAFASGHDVFWSGRLDGLDWLWGGLSGWFADDAPAVARPPGTVLSPADDAASLAALAREVGADAVHVDHYLLGPELRDHLNATGVVLSSVEDFHTGRRPADVVVDPNLGADGAPRPDDGSPVLLRGPRYAPLRESVRRARIAREGRSPVGTPERPGPVSAGSRPPSGPPRVLVVMGGTDAAGLLPRVVDALAAAGAPAEVDVVVPTGRAFDLPGGFRAVAPLSDLPGAAAGVDLVVSAAGTTVWELCCVGVPMALVLAADNQVEGYRAVTAAGAAAGLGGAGDLGGPDARATLHRLLTEPSARDGLAVCAREVVDGRGVERVLAALDDAVGTVPDRPSPGAALTAREASDADADLLLAWRNDPETRRWSRVPDPVEPSRHREWLRGSLERADRMLVVVEDAVGPVGTVRWDRDGIDDTTWEVSITVAPDRRGRGLAAPLLSAGENALRERTGTPTSVRAVVHRENGASATLFARAGYRPAGPADDAGFAPHRKDLA